MPEPRPVNRARVGVALLASAAVFLIAAVLVAAGTFALPAETRRIATLALSGIACADALLALTFLWRASARP
jgi:hypothetical protein